MGSAISIEKQHLIERQETNPLHAPSNRFLVLLRFFSGYVRGAPPRWSTAVAGFRPVGDLFLAVVVKYIDDSPVNVISHLLISYDWASDLFYPPVDTSISPNFETSQTTNGLQAGNVHTSSTLLFARCQFGRALRDAETARVNPVSTPSPPGEEPNCITKLGFSAVVLE